MADIFNAVVRPLGSSACVLIPKEQLEKEGLKIGDSVDVTLLVHRHPSALDRLLGLARGANAFVRDKKSRGFDATSR